VPLKVSISLGVWYIPRMRVVSLVPSWTETLIEAGVDVVGRTRFCLHPRERVKAIPTVGGTKDADWEKIRTLGADLVILDREENTREMAEACPLPWHATHVSHMRDLPSQLQTLSEKLSSPRLGEFAARWEKIVASPKRAFSLQNPPGLVKWVTPPPKTAGEICYVIWAHPWMAAGPDTFIGSVLDWCGWKVWGTGKYPKFEPTSFDAQTLFLCSTEPFPFAKRPDVMAELPGAVALVDGEKISWFGLRSLMYLESLF